jgi:threonine dehydratase
MFDLPALRDAARIVYRSMQPTAQIAWPLLASRTNCDVWVKHENHTPTGAFKVRGGLIYLEGLKRTLPAGGGIIGATRGNHGQSLAFAANRAGIRVSIVVPVNNSPEKNAAMRAFGAELIEVGTDFDQAREVAQNLAGERGLAMVPSFDPELARGVATYALELFTSVRDLETVYVPIGMGSGICGVIRTRDLLGLRTKVVGVVSAHAPAFALSFAGNEIVTTTSARTIADGMACRVPVAEALDFVRRGAERIVQVTDDEIAAAIRAYHVDTHNLAEGAGAAPLAALLQEQDQMRGKRVGLILSGGNIDRMLLAEILAERSAQAEFLVSGGNAL